MLNCEDLEFSWEGVSVASCQISMSRHGINVVVTQPYDFRSDPDFTCSIRIQA